VSLEIADEKVGEVRVLALQGRLDTETSSDLELAMQDILQTGERQFVLDLSGIGYVSSSGLRVLLMLAKSVDGNGRLCLAGLNATVRQVFDVAGFTPLFAIVADRAAALASFPQSGAGGAPGQRDEPGVEPALSDSDLVPRLLAVLAPSPASDGAGKMTADDIARVARVLGA
jgi:anti-anti-sigma factor